MPIFNLLVIENRDLIFCSGFGDLDNTSKIILFSPGSAVGSSNCVSFNIIDDLTQESEEFFTITTDRNDLFNESVARIIIQDNDSRFDIILLPT